MQIDWYFDVISPFAYLQWPQVRALMREHDVRPRPILFAGLLDHLGQKGPAEIPAKRVFTYRHVVWRAHAQGLPLRFPPAHPFNPLPALRLCIAAGCSPVAIDAIFEWIWAQGRAADSVDALRPLAEQLGIAEVDAAIAAPDVKAALRSNFDAAIAAGVFGVPTLAIRGELFWGEDASEFARACIDHPELLQQGEYARVAELPVAASRT